MLIESENTVIESDKLLVLGVGERKAYNDEDETYIEYGIACRIAENFNKEIWLQTYSTKERAKEVYKELLNTLLDSQKIYCLPKE